MGVFIPKFEGVIDHFTMLSALVRGTDEGKLCKISANGTVALGDAESDIFGVIETIDPSDKAAVVRRLGAVTIGYTSTAPTVGTQCRLVHDGSAGVKIKTAGAAVGDKLFTILSVDSSGATVTFLLG